MKRLPRKKKKQIRKAAAKSLFQEGFEIMIFGFTINEFEYN